MNTRIFTILLAIITYTPTSLFGMSPESAVSPQKNSCLKPFADGFRSALKRCAVLRSYGQCDSESRYDLAKDYLRCYAALPEQDQKREKVESTTLTEVICEGQAQRYDIDGWPISHNGVALEGHLCCISHPLPGEKACNVIVKAEDMKQAALSFPEAKTEKSYDGSSYVVIPQGGSTFAAFFWLRFAQEEAQKGNRPIDDYL